MSFTVYSRVGGRYFSFDKREAAYQFYNEFPGDAVLMEGADILDKKMPIDSFSDVVKTSIYLQHRIIAEPTQGDMRVYDAVVNVLKEGATGILLTGDIGVGKSTLMKTIAMCASSDIIANVQPFTIIELRQLHLLYAESQHRAFEQLGLSSLNAQLVCLDNIVDEYLTLQHYKTTVNLLGEFVEERYALFEKSAISTHFVTNLTVRRLHETLGDRRYQMLLRLITQVDMHGEGKNV